MRAAECQLALGHRAHAMLHLTRDRAGGPHGRAARHWSSGISFDRLSVVCRDSPKNDREAAGGRVARYNHPVRVGGRIRARPLPRAPQRVPRTVRERASPQPRTARATVSHALTHSLLGHRRVGRPMHALAGRMQPLSTLCQDVQLPTGARATLRGSNVLCFASSTRVIGGFHLIGMDGPAGRCAHRRSAVIRRINSSMLAIVRRKRAET